MVQTGAVQQGRSGVIRSLQPRVWGKLFGMNSWNSYSRSRTDRPSCGSWYDLCMDYGNDRILRGWKESERLSIPFLFPCKSLHGLFSMFFSLKKSVNGNVLFWIKIGTVLVLFTSFFISLSLMTKWWSSEKCGFGLALKTHVRFSLQQVTSKHNLFLSFGSMCPVCLASIIADIYFFQTLNMPEFLLLFWAESLQHLQIRAGNRRELIKIKISLWLM